jgi:hypothetical protein
VILKAAESEKAAQERQGMIGQGLVYFMDSSEKSVGEFGLGQLAK